MEEPGNECPYSVNNDTPTYVQFMNNTGRIVHLFWFDYTGELMRYGDIPPMKSTSIDTYVTHPWMARDSRTAYPLLLNGKQIFYPVVQREDVVFHDFNRDQIKICIPVFSLLRRCLEEMYLHFQLDNIDLTSLPRDVKEMLLKISPTKDFKDYSSLDEIVYEDNDEMDGDSDSVDDGDSDNVDDGDSDR